MPVYGSGIVPASGAVANELTAVTRRAFIPTLVVQIYSASPTLAAGLANGQTASGGLSSVTVPVQGTPLTTAQATGYDGSFNRPTGLTGISNAEFNLKCVVVPVQFLGMEGLVQMNASIIPIIEARMNDAGNQAADYLATKLATNATNGTIDIDGFPLISSGSLTYGNIDPTTNTWWVGNARASAGAAPTRQTVLNDLVSAAAFNGGEMPNIGVTGPGTWEKLAEDFVGQEVYQITPGSAFSDNTQGPRAAFTALMVAGVPVYWDPYFAEGTIYYWNTRYSSFYIHEAAGFVFSGFASTLPNNQLGYIGVVVCVLEFLTTKRKSWTSRPGYTSNVLT